MEVYEGMSEPVELVCLQCHKPFLVKASHAHLRKRCSRACQAEAMRGVPPNRPPTEKKYRACVVCGKGFRTYPSTRRSYCSYGCHLASGGAFRAGIAASAARLRYGAKKDANHREVVEALERLGVSFIDLSTMGRGVPDGIAVANRRNHFVEIKNPLTAYGRRGLNPIQKKWAAQWRGMDIYILKSVADAETFAAGELEKLEMVRCGEQKDEA